MSNGTIIADPNLFPNGLKPVVDYVRSKGLQFGIYTARGSTTCCGKPGSDGYEVIDANYYASIGVSYLKEDSCGGTTHGTVWEQYARMRDALNNTGKPIYFSVTEAVPWHDGHPKMSCYGQDSIFTVIPWLQQGLDPRTLANSYLVEYCNNEARTSNSSRHARVCVRSHIHHYQLFVLGSVACRICGATPTEILSLEGSSPISTRSSC